MKSISSLCLTCKCVILCRPIKKLSLLKDQRWAGRRITQSNQQEVQQKRRRAMRIRPTLCTRLIRQSSHKASIVTIRWTQNLKLERVRQALYRGSTICVRTIKDHLTMEKGLLLNWDLCKAITHNLRKSCQTTLALDLLPLSITQRQTSKNPIFSSANLTSFWLVSAQRRCKNS